MLIWMPPAAVHTPSYGCGGVDHHISTTALSGQNNRSSNVWESFLTQLNPPDQGFHNSIQSSHQYKDTLTTQPPTVQIDSCSPVN